jgi:pyruvate/2-oxoglutarate dehydrogenase complex dihydrolipoamide acyltransferase (E2) component
MRQQRAAGGGGVDIGNTRMNTQEAANYVRDRKLDQLREQAAAPAAPPAAAPAPPAPVMQSPVPMMGSKSGEIKRAFAGVRERLGEVRYNAELAAAGVGDPLRLRSLVEARALFKRLWNAAASEVA